jgi:hypothetical protein
MTAPIVERHQGIAVVRDDLFAGGTKARFLGVLFNGVEEVVYATPAQGGAQFALAHVARELGKRATLFVAQRGKPHPRALEAKRLGAKVIQVANGYLNVVQARAREYCLATGARLAPFGMDLPEAAEAIVATALASGEDPTDVWCAGGSGVLGRALRRAWPDARVHVVMVGRNACPVEGADHIVFPRPFEWQAVQPPFLSDPHYDAKAWAVAASRPRPGRHLFWNVAGPAVP